MSDVPAAFSYLHTVTLAAFGTTTAIWFPAETGHAGHKAAAAYTEEIPCAAGPLTAKNAAGFGLVTMPADGIVLQATKSAFPFEPRAEQHFILGTSAAAGRRYRIVSVTGSEGIHSHYRILAEKV